ncbi:methyl-accepting chemotaxis protein [Andreprevotia chitinilytica]|uniref:methyl-accepting chemotaxis protein n=1 Tax=Andreprevotia chitinilytica TaxID=396808 RepID=UPI000556EACC|nr:CHASE3 domain-containing protein [Andreprevotia chitinilytica]
MRFSISAKLWAAFIPILLVIVVVGSSAYQNTRKLVDTAQWVAHTHIVVGQLTDMLSALQDAETGQRGYLITGEDRYLEPYNSAGPKLDAAMRNLKTLTADNPEQQKRLASISPLADAKLVELKETIDLRRNKGFEVARSVVLSDRGKKAMDDIRVLTSEMGNAESALLKIREEEAKASTQTAFITIVVGFLIAAALVIAAAIFLGQHIGGPLKEVTAAAEQISSGDLSLDLTQTARTDEIGTLTRTFAQMQEALRAIASITERVAAGDLSVQPTPQSDKDVLGNAVTSMVLNLREMTREILNGINVLAGSAAEIQAGMTQIASGAQETATSIGETSSTAEEVKQTAMVSSQKAKSVSEAAQKVTLVSQTGRKAVDDVVEGMQRIHDQMALIADSIVRLSEQTQAIGEIIATVNDLAEQSNLLAVNASIEAAKAGEHGKGFAVVAQEVKSLAEQSKQATVQVRQILGEIQKATSGAVLATEQGGKAVEGGLKQSSEAGDAIRVLTESIVESAQSATQIAVSAQQQLAGMDQLALALDNIRTAGAQNIASARQAETAAQNLHSLGQTLKDMLARYKL